MSDVAKKTFMNAVAKITSQLMVTKNINALMVIIKIFSYIL